MFCKIGEIVCLNACKDALVANVWFFSTLCFQMLSPIVCLHTYNHTCCIVTRWNGFSPECFLCDLSNRCRKSYICHTNYRRNVLKSFFHFRSGARCDEGLPEENGLPASEPMYVTSEQSRACQKDKDRRGPAAPEIQEDQAWKLRFRFVHIFSMNTSTLHKPHRNIADLNGIGLKSLWAPVFVGLGANLADCCTTVCFMN